MTMYRFPILDRKPESGNVDTKNLLMTLKENDALNRGLARIMYICMISAILLSYLLSSIMIYALDSSVSDKVVDSIGGAIFSDQIRSLKEVDQVSHYSFVTSALVSLAICVIATPSIVGLYSRAFSTMNYRVVLSDVLTWRLAFPICFFGFFTYLAFTPSIPAETAEGIRYLGSSRKFLWPVYPAIASVALLFMVFLVAGFCIAVFAALHLNRERQE